MAIAELMFSDQAVLQERLVRRQVRRSFFWGTSRFALWSIRETMRALRYSAGLIRENAVKSSADAPIVVKEGLRRALLKASYARKPLDRVKAFASVRPADLARGSWRRT